MNVWRTTCKSFAYHKWYAYHSLGNAGLNYIKFCFFLSPFGMGLINPDLALERSSQLSISRKLSTLFGTQPFSTNLFRLPSLLALLVGLNLSILIAALVWFFKITILVPFESVEVLLKDRFLVLYFSLSSLIIFRLLCLLPSAALLTLTIWPLVLLPLGPHCSGGYTKSFDLIGAL